MNDDPNYYNGSRQFNVPGLIGGLLFGHPNGGYYPGYPPFPPYQPYPPYQGVPMQPVPPPQTQGAPMTPPPSFTPTKPAFQTYAINPGAIQGCMFQFTYIWLKRDAFWFYPTFVGRNSISGFRWRRNRWVYYGIDLDNIESFQCF